MNNDESNDDAKLNSAEDLMSSLAQNFKSKQETKEGTKVINNKLTKLKTLEWGLRYLDVFEDLSVDDITEYYGVSKKKLINFNKVRLNLSFHKGIVKAGSTIIIPEPSDDYYQGTKTKMIGGRKGHRAGINVEMGSSLMKKGYNPSITYD